MITSLSAEDYIKWSERILARTIKSPRQCQVTESDVIAFFLSLSLLVEQGLKCSKIQDSQGDSYQISL